MITTAESFQVAVYRRLVPAQGDAPVPRATRLVAGSMVDEREREGVVQLAGHMRYPTPRTVSTNRT